MRGRQAEAARNDTALLDAAREVFAVHGPAAPVALIAERAGVGIASLYRRHPTKEALLQHLCQAAKDQTTAAAKAVIETTAPWRGLCGFLSFCVEASYGALMGLVPSISTTTKMNKTF